MRLPRPKCQYGRSSVVIENGEEKIIIESCKLTAKRVHGEIAVCIPHWLKLREAECGGKH